MRDVVICEPVRTPIGRYGGALSSVRPDDLAAFERGVAALDQAMARVTQPGSGRGAAFPRSRGAAGAG